MSQNGPGIKGKRDERIQAEENAIVALFNETLRPHTDGVIVPPPTYFDRTKPDRDRFMEKVRPKINKKTLKEVLRSGDNILKGNYANLMRGVHVDGTHYVPTSSVSGDTVAADGVKLPIGIGEPIWKPGRDKPGGGGGGPDASSDPDDLVYVDITYEEFIELLLGNFDLPFLLAKDMAKMLVYTLKIRGVKATGPRSRVDLKATYVARLKRFRAVYNRSPERFPELTRNSIPTVIQFPFDNKDLRYKRVEEVWDPDSKAVAFMMLDRSGSMGGEPLAIAKLYFLLNVIWLRTKYKDVAVVFIAHDADAHRVPSEQDFYRIFEGGGTMFVPAYEMAWDIGQREFPAGSWNRYAFHATDGYGFEPTSDMVEAIEKLIRGDFNYFGYLEINPYGDSGWGWGGKTPGMKAVEDVAEDVAPHVGFARVSNMDQVPEAMQQILVKDKVQ